MAVNRRQGRHGRTDVRTYGAHAVRGLARPAALLVAGAGRRRRRPEDAGAAQRAVGGGEKQEEREEAAGVHFQRERMIWSDGGELS